MCHKILVPLDGSTFAEQALPVALSLARRAGAEVELACVHVPPAPLYAGCEIITSVDVETALREHEHNYLQDVARRATESGGQVSVSTRILDGAVGEALSARARETSANLVVMTTHGRSPLGRLLLGSIADQLVRRLDVPLLLVRPQGTPTDFTADSLPRRVLVPLDGSPLAEEILEPATSLGRLMQADFLLLRIVPPAMSSNYPMPTEAINAFGKSLLKQLEEQEAAARREAEAYLEKVARRLRSEGLVVRTRVVSHDLPAAAILEQAQADTADLIALETHGRHGIARLFLGSVAEKVLRGASIPLLVQRPRQAMAGRSEPKTTDKSWERIADDSPLPINDSPENPQDDNFPGCFHGEGIHTTAEAKCS